MRRVGPNSFTEIYFAGCNPSFVETTDGYVMIDSPQQPIDAVRWRERMEEKAPIRYLINTEPHGDHISGNAYFPNVTVVGQVKLQECFERYLYAFGSLDEIGQSDQATFTLRRFKSQQLRKFARGRHAIQHKHLGHQLTLDDLKIRYATIIGRLRNHRAACRQKFTDALAAIRRITSK